MGEKACAPVMSMLKTVCQDCGLNNVTFPAQLHIEGIVHPKIWETPVTCFTFMSFFLLLNPKEDI